MTSKEFKGVFFNQIARAHGFEKAYSGWFKESDECIAVLDLQKSNYSDYYYLNIKLFVQGMFGNEYRKSKDLVKRDIGNIFERQPGEYHDVFDFETPMDDEKRINRLEALFIHHIDPLIEKGSTKEGIKELGREGRIQILPAVAEQLENLSR
jgi:hypothetical protein